ncbi:hypothetical protein [Dyadobacter sp. CY312]|uniref:hypothetical protein n=1 Tax=Dyadobacter sp. CY312 TaxID=2907303 RepID=UPI001F29B97C|nr:hypothetical protein [Dyadobacter sp. CY312]MCE7044603.1 hypothetical protein [Dyadobacter sp. CY312]
MKIIQITTIILIAISILVSELCEPVLKGTFTSKKLVSSKGESLFINSINWGVTDDKQLSSISKNEKKLRERADSAVAVKGLDPFIYSFRNDSLNLFFDGEVSYVVPDSFSSITITYHTLSKSEMANLLHMAMKNDGYHMVPARP